MGEVPKNEPLPKRHWFRFAFRLRTLFVAVTVLGIALGWWTWQVKLVRERKEFVTQIENQGGLLLARSGVIPAVGGPDIPFWRTWLGDRQQYIIAIKKRFDPNYADFTDPDDLAFFNRAKRLFPEAEIHFGLSEAETKLQDRGSQLKAEYRNRLKRSGMPKD